MTTASADTTTAAMARLHSRTLLAALDTAHRLPAYGVDTATSTAIADGLYEAYRTGDHSDLTDLFVTVGLALDEAYREDNKEQERLLGAINDDIYAVMSTS